MAQVVAAPGSKKDTRTTLKGMTLPQLKDWAASAGEPPYRGAQLFDWMYHKGETDPRAMDNLPTALRERLAEMCDLSTALIAHATSSGQEPTRKYLMQLRDGKQVEAVSMLEQGRHTVCVSSQVGCNVDCHFCATASMGLVRNLTVGEIVDQCLLVQGDRPEPITNVVFMGMGEPLLNYDRVMAAADILHSPQGMNLGGQRITISTAGVVPKILRFTDENRPYRFAISLNATTDAVRSEIMPINRTWPLAELLAAARAYAARSQRTVTFEYVLLAGINDAPQDARRLAVLLRGLRCKVNLIPYNELDPLPGQPNRYRRPTPAAIETFIGALSGADFPVLTRWSNGTDIAAGCGQLAVSQA